MKKLFLSAIVALLSVATMSATTIYCKMAQDWWKVDGAAVAVHYWGGAGAGTTWPGARMTSVENDVWSYDVPTDVTGLMFVRVNGSGDIADWGAKTKDLTFPTDGNNLYTITSTEPVWGDPGCDGAWSKYEGGASAIQHVNATLDLNAPMFDILGRKVNADYKGIVIQNGKKFIR